jgi:NAD(P)-dependent dehydrogenase (short-subunit alcohol dehydrogenase family)
MSELAGQVSIVTGAAQGIGLGIARSLAAAGSAVMIVDINAEKASAAAAALAEQGYRTASAGADVGAQADVAAMVEKTLDSFGRIDVLVSNAGGSGHVALPTIEETDEAAWDAVVSSNLRGTYLCARAVVPHMKEQKVAGRIINFSSVVTRGSSGGVGTVGARLPYAASKAGIEALSRQLAHDLHPFKITVNCVVPGMIMTEPGARMHERFSKLDREMQDRVLDMFNGDFAGPDDVGALVAFLASRSARHITGQSIPIGIVG